MKTTPSYSEINDMFEDTARRAAQLMALAVIMHDALDAGTVDIKELQNGLGLVIDLQGVQREAIVALHESHIRNNSR